MELPQIVAYIVTPVAAYLLGSIPFAFVIGKAHGVDIRKVGSGNVGATNLARAMGHQKYFWHAFFLDVLKGFAPVLAMALYTTAHARDPAPLPSFVPLLAGAAAMLGHIYPLWLGFRGGKGVATAFGVVLGLWPLYTIAGLGGGLVFVLVFMAYRYISLASMVGAACFAILVLILGQSSYPLVHRDWPDLGPLVAVAAAIALLIIIKHRSNIARLLAGTEPRWGEKGKS